MTRRRHREHESAMTLRHGQVTLVVPLREWFSSTVTSIDWGLDAYFPNHQPGSEVHHRSGSRALRVPLQPTVRLGYTATYITNFKSG
jgi:hypothetical protein